MLQIITWNDFAESHYISDLVPSQILPEAKGYVDGYDHGGFRAVLPWYVAAYKLGKTAEEGLSDDQWPKEKLGDGVVSAWYRTTPVNVTGCSDGGTKWGQNGEKSAKEAIEKDVVNVLAVVRRDTEVVVSVEETGKKVVTKVKKGGARFFQVGFEELGLTEGKGGKVRIEMNGESREGKEVKGECYESGVVSSSFFSFFALMWTDANRWEQLNFNAATVYIAKSTHKGGEGDDSHSGGSGSGSGGNSNGTNSDGDGDENAAVSGRSVGATAALVAFFGFALLNL